MNRIPKLIFSILVAVVVSAGCGDCGSNNGGGDTGPTDTSGGDGGGPTPDAGDTGGADMDGADADAGEDPQPGERVGIDLTEYTGGGPGGGTVRVFQSTDPSELVAEGLVLQGRAGDWVIENDRVRFVVENAARAIGPCPFGGHIVDGDRLDVETGGDTIYEMCPFINAGSTLKAETFEVIADGSDGGAGVLAVTGELEIADWVNFNTMAGDIGFEGLPQLAVGPNRIPPVTMTLYYVLRPGDIGVRVVSAIRNDDAEQVDLFIGELIAGGGDGTYFNPISSVGGWGYASVSVDAFSGEPMPFVGYGGPESSYAWVPEPDPGLTAPLPSGGRYLAVSNIVIAAPGATDLLPIILAQENQIPNHPQLTHLAPGGVHESSHRVFVGSGSLASMLDEIYPSIGQTTGTASGRVVDSDANPVAGALVTAVDADDRPMNQARTASDGTFSMRVPPGDYTFRARRNGLPRSTPPSSTTVSAGAEAMLGDIPLTQPHGVSVSVRLPDGVTPVPARVTVLCEGACPGSPDPREMDVDLDRLPAEFATIEHADPATGDVTFDLPPGEYRVMVSRGMAWSVFPPDAMDTGGQLLDLSAGGNTQIDAEIAPVVDMTGALSADFHVHTVSSQDSHVPHVDRIRGFVSDGLDVAVSSDHDYIADYGPAVTELGVEDEIVPVVGLEVTTSDLGHFNAFPLERDAQHRRGGALDWAGGTGPALLPADIFAALDMHPGEQVVQVNHANSLGLINNTTADPLRGISLADPSMKRLPATMTDPMTGDTGLWTDDFTAYEVQNGNDFPQMWVLFRWWLTMIGRGFSPTGTAVTDTHQRYSHLGTTPRSIVFVGAGSDTPATFDAATFVDAINSGRVVGTNGPMVGVQIRNAADETATLGEVVDGSDGTVTAEVTIQVPEWMGVDTIDVFSNLDSVVTDPAEQIPDPVTPSQTVPVTLEATDLVDVDSGTQTHRVYTKTVTISLDVTEDSYFVFVVRGENAPDLYPMVRERNLMPFAFTNPVFVDFDGNGYDNPPLQDLLSTQPPPTPPPPPGEPRPPTPDELIHMFEGGHAH